MSAAEHRAQVIARLEHLEATGQLSARQRPIALQLRDRLSRPVSVGLLGADTMARDAVRRALLTQLPEDCRLVSASDDASADIPLWCSTDGPEVDRDWADLEPGLRDKCLFVHVSTATASGPGDHKADAPCLTLDEADSSSQRQLCDQIAGLLCAGRDADLDTAEMVLRRYGVTELVPQVAPRVDPPAAEASALQVALDFLSGVAWDLNDHCPDQADPDVAAVLSICRHAATSLSDMLQTCDDPALRDIILAAEDQIQLMELEGELSSAVDGTTCLLQVQRDLAVRLAA